MKTHPHAKTAAAVILFTAALCVRCAAQTYEVGPGKPLAAIANVPWANLLAGDTVLIYWRSAPYHEKWVICRQGAANAPITVRGVPDPVSGALPVIDGSGATTPAPLNFWNQERSVIKIGGANTPADTLPQYINIENLEICNGRPDFKFTAANGVVTPYGIDASGLYLEKGQHIVIRGCALHDNANGLFIASSSGLTQDVLVEQCYFHDNGVVNSKFQHSSYTECTGIVFQYNHFGPLAPNCLGAQIKDRSAGTVIRYNWVEGGDRNTDLVDSSTLYALPSYRSAFVYGNIFLKFNSDPNTQVCHYGGDSGITAQYRKGTLYFYNNTIVSMISGNTTLFALSTNSESADCRNNIVHVASGTGRLAVLDSTGAVALQHNWIQAGWTSSFSNPGAAVANNGGNMTGASPGFANEAAQDFDLAAGSPCIHAGATVAAAAQGANAVTQQYVPHLGSAPRAGGTPLDIGAFGYGAAAIAPSITTQPINQIVAAGHTATFIVTASGTATLTYQWQKNNANISGATGASYTTPATTTADGGSTFRCVVSNSAGSATSIAATLTVNAANTPPTIASAAYANPNPALAGQSVLFSVAASDGDGDTLSYSWNFGDGSTATGASATHAFTAAGTYTATATVSDGAGNSAASSAIVTVNANVTPALHVAAITMSLSTTSTGKAGIATVTIKNASGATVGGATVTGKWSGLTSASVSGNTGSMGKARFTSARTKSTGTFKFTVTNVTATGYIYAASQNAAGSGSITTSGVVTLAAPLAAAPAGTALAALNAVSLGSVNANKTFKLALPRPEDIPASGAVRTASKNLPKGEGLRVSGGNIGGKPAKAGTFTFTVQFQAKTTSVDASGVSTPATILTEQQYTITVTQ